MKIGIFGLPLSGKKTVFRMLSGSDPGAQARGEPLEGFALIDDARLYELQRVYRPARTVKARLDLELLPDMDAENTASGKIFPLLGACDALCPVIRGFEDAAVYHPEGSVDPGRDLRRISSELLLHDLALAEKRIEKIQKETKSQKGPRGRELELMERIRNSLEEEKPLRALPLDGSEKSLVSGYAFLTIKPVVCVINAGEGEGSESGLDSTGKDDSISFVMFSAKLESEIDEFPPGAEKNAMLEEMGIKAPAAGRLKREFLSALNLLTFFTATGEELREWLAPADSTAEKAAGKIHSDMERGFIKAEIIKFSDLMESGSEEKAARLGKKHLKGRDYILSDGDIVNIRFNV